MIPEPVGGQRAQASRADAAPGPSERSGGQARAGAKDAGCEKKSQLWRKAVDTQSMDTKKTVFDDVVHCVEREHTMMNTFIGEAERQRDALVAFDTAVLLDAVRKQQEIAESIRRLELERTRAIAAAFGVSIRQAGTITLSFLRQHAPEPQGHKLAKLQEELRAQAVRLNELTTLNKVLAERGRKFIRAVTEMVTSGGQPLYSKTI
jgi:hypothetical protein